MKNLSSIAYYYLVFNILRIDNWWDVILRTKVQVEFFGKGKNFRAQFLINTLYTHDSRKYIRRTRKRFEARGTVLKDREIVTRWKILWLLPYRWNLLSLHEARPSLQYSLILDYDTHVTRNVFSRIDLYLTLKKTTDPEIPRFPTFSSTSSILEKLNSSIYTVFDRYLSCSKGEEKTGELKNLRELTWINKRVELIKECCWDAGRRTGGLLRTVSSFNSLKAFKALRRLLIIHFLRRLAVKRTRFTGSLDVISTIVSNRPDTTIRLEADSQASGFFLSRLVPPLVYPALLTIPSLTRQCIRAHTDFEWNLYES